MQKHILLLANGGREHAIAKALKRSSKYDVVLYGFFNAKNPGLTSLCETYEICTEKNFGEENGFQSLQDFAAKYPIDFAIIGPDDPIGAGAVDALKKINIESMAPTKTCARLESSKGFTRSLLQKNDIEGNPLFERFTSANESTIEDFCQSLPAFVIKNDGLCGGKGVFVQDDHFGTKEEGIQIAKEMIAKGDEVVIEEKLIGPEFSLMFFADGKTAVAMPDIADHKRAYEDDQGPNTGGMGTISFPQILPFLTPADIEAAQIITEKVMHALEKECSERFVGIMYGGFMKTPNGVRLIEYNARFGDPEALNALPLLKTDLVDIAQSMIDQTLNTLNVEFNKKATVCKYVVPEGYPTNALKGEPLTINMTKIPEGVELFFASVEGEEQDGDIITLTMKGSRSVGVVGIDDDFAVAEQKCEQAIQDAFSGRYFHRSDIGTQKLLEKRMK